jgi:hypothetical protein
MLYTYVQARQEWAIMGGGELDSYIRENFARVYDEQLHFLGFERK